jgi:hypothetical protein
MLCDFILKPVDFLPMFADFGSKLFDFRLKSIGFVARVDNVPEPISACLVVLFGLLIQFFDYLIRDTGGDLCHVE